MIDEKPLNPVKKLKKKIERSLKSDKQIIDKKPPNLVKVLRKNTNALCVRLCVIGLTQ